MDRRDFLRSSALATGAAVATSLPLSGALVAEPVRGPVPTHPATNILPQVNYADISPLSRLVFEQRIDRARRLMREASADALVATSGSTDFEYLVGADFGRSERLIALVLTVNGPPVIVAPSFELSRVRQGAQVAEVRGWEESENPFDLVRSLLTSSRARTILIEPRTDYWVASRIAKGLPDAQLVDGSALFEGLRLLKGEDELVRMRRAIAITEDAIAITFDNLQSGMRDVDVARLLAEEHAKRGVTGGGLVQFGPQSAMPHGGTTRAVLAPGTVVLIDAGCRFQGYTSDITRTRWFGDDVPPKFRQVYNTVYDAQSAAMAKVTPEVPAQEIDRAAREVITKAGFGKYFTHRLGHGIGLDGHEAAYMVKGNTLPLKPGFVFSVEPGIYIPNEFGVRLEDDFTCTATGGMLLSRRAPRMV